MRRRRRRRSTLSGQVGAGERGAARLASGRSRSEHGRRAVRVAVLVPRVAECDGAGRALGAVHGQRAGADGDAPRHDASRAARGGARDPGAAGAGRAAAGVGRAAARALLPHGRVPAAGGGARAGAPDALLGRGALRARAARRRPERPHHHLPG